MAQQTAINWLIDQIRSEQNQKALSGKEWMEVIEQAKAMEKEQIVNAYDAGLFDGTMDDANDRIYKQYYNETYGK